MFLVGTTAWKFLGLHTQPECDLPISTRGLLSGVNRVKDETQTDIA